MNTRTQQGGDVTNSLQRIQYQVTPPSSNIEVGALGALTGGSAYRGGKNKPAKILCKIRKSAIAL